MPSREVVLHAAAGQRLPLEALAATAHCHAELIRRFVSYGLLEPVGGQETAPWFDLRAIPRVRRIERLRKDLGINLAGIAAVLDLLERNETLQRELDRLRRR